MALTAPTYIAYACVTHDNYIWLMTILRLVQHAIGMGTSLSTSNLIYVNLPETDQDSYIVFNSLAANVTGLLCTAICTSIVAAMGTSTWNILGLSFSSVPVLLLIQAALAFIVPVVIMLLRPWMDPTFSKK